MDSFKLRIVTPVGVAVEADVSSVTIPSTEGEIGILPHHCQYTGLVGIGILTYNSTDGATVRIAVSGGFCQFVGDTLTVLADASYAADTVDRAHYATERNDLQKIVDVEDTQSSAWIVAREKLSRIEAIDSLLG